MSTLPSGRCEVCSRVVAVRRNGTAREHRKRESVNWKCSGSGKKAVPYSDGAPPHASADAVPRGD